MSPDQIFRKIESPEFALTLGLSGSRTRAMQTLVRLPEVEDLLKVLGEDVEATRMVANRAATLVETEIDLRYTHPADAAIAVYLRALDILNSDLALVLASTMARLRTNLWWSLPIIDSLRRLVKVTNVAVAVADFEAFFWLGQERAESVRRKCSTPNEGLSFDVGGTAFRSAGAPDAVNVDLPRSIRSRRYAADRVFAGQKFDSDAGHGQYPFDSSPRISIEQRGMVL